MLSNKDIRVENGFLIINGDKYPLDGQSPETIMEIVENNSDTTPTENSDAPITSGGVYTALGTKQDTLTFDSAPTDSSTNPVTSGGVYTALAGKQDALTISSGVITLNSGWNFDSGVVNTVKRMGDVAWLSSYIYSTDALTAGTFYEIGTLPSDFIPAKAYKFPIYGGLDATAIRGRIEIQNTGKIIYLALDTSRYILYTTIIYPLT